MCQKRENSAKTHDWQLKIWRMTDGNTVLVYKKGVTYICLKISLFSKFCDDSFPIYLVSKMLKDIFFYSWNVVMIIECCSKWVILKPIIVQYASTVIFLCHFCPPVILNSNIFNEFSTIPLIWHSGSKGFQWKR